MVPTCTPGEKLVLARLTLQNNSANNAISRATLLVRNAPMHNNLVAIRDIFKSMSRSQTAESEAVRPQEHQRQSHEQNLKRRHACIPLPAE